MRPVTFSSLSCMALPNFSTLSHSRISEKVLLNIKFVLIFFHKFAWNISHLKSNSARQYHKYTRLHVKCPLFLSVFNETWIFSTYFRKTLKYQMSWKSVHWVVSCSKRTDRQTGRHEEPNSRFSQFCERTEKLVSSWQVLQTSVTTVHCTQQFENKY
jgi:hypothetical protein